MTAALGKPGLTTDQEELEHTAWLAAVEDALQHTDGGARRRVVAAADVDSDEVLQPSSPDRASRVEVAAPVERRWVVSFHVDETPGSTAATDLLWFDVTELDEVAGSLGCTCAVEVMAHGCPSANTSIRWVLSTG